MMYKNLQIWELNYTQKDDIQFKCIHREELWFVTCPLPPLPPEHPVSPFTMGHLILSFKPSGGPVIARRASSLLSV